ncbi:MAG: hypothetical protein V4591_01420 [Bdellovibrionota bacterium]
MVNTKQKKELGAWGEKILDQWMKHNNWNPIQKNLRIKKGEIDRIYFHKNRDTKLTRFCITEVKTSLYYGLKDVEILFTETGVKRYLKQKQIRNLYRYGENLIALLNQHKKSHYKVYLRFFIVLKSGYAAMKITAENLPKSPAIKNCFAGDDFLIFAIEPEFTKTNARKSLLQTSCY